MMTDKTKVRVEMFGCLRCHHLNLPKGRGRKTSCLYTTDPFPIRYLKRCPKRRRG